MVKIPKASLTKIDIALVAGPRSLIDAHAVLVHPSLGVDRVSGERLWLWTRERAALDA